MIALVLAVALAAAEPVATCHSDTAVLTVVLEGVEVDVGEQFVLRRLWTGPEGEETKPRTVVAVGTVEDAAQGRIQFQLTVGDPWSLRRGGEEVELRVPRALRPPESVHILGVGPAHVWLAAPGGLARVSVAEATFETARVGRRGQTALALAIDDAALVVSGTELLHCTAPSTCVRLAQLPAPVAQVVAGPGGWLLAIDGRDGGLYRAPASMPAAAESLIAGEVAALCAGVDGETWAVLMRDDEVRVVAASTDTPAVRPFSPAEIFSRGIGTTSDADVVAHILRVAHTRAWPELEHMALAMMTDGRPGVRQNSAAALSGVLGARATAALWLLGRDEVAEVRVEALYASAARCQDDSAVTCPHVLSAFMGDDDTEVAWTARDLLLDFDPRAALDSAPATYKIDAIAALVGRLQRHGDLAAERALEMLAADPEPTVRAAARMALAGAGR